LAAFAGITTALSQTFYGGFICGLPSLFFDMALCWIPSFPCQRRVPSCSSSATMAGLPSWSWAGWEGYIDISLWLSGYDYIKSSQSAVGCLSSVRIVSTVQWYCRPWGTKESRPIQGPNELNAWRALATEDRHNLPVGWTRFEYNSDESFGHKHRHRWPTSTPRRYYYKHRYAPTTEFWYPIPLCEGLQSPPPRRPETLINCRTQRTWLNLGTDPSRYWLRDAEEAWVGTLSPQDEIECELFSNSGDKLVCELVEISRGYAYEKDVVVGMCEWDHSERPKSPDGEKYEFVNVLWVEWEDGIAYRKGVGRVMKSAWEAQELEWIDLVLG
jgi:hypothetical protein